MLWDVLDLFFNPLLALLMLFLECVTLCFGTAKTIGGSSSRRDARAGMAKYHGLCWVVDAKESIREVNDVWRVEAVEAVRGRETKGKVDRDVLAMRDKAVIFVVVVYFYSWRLFGQSQESS